MENKEMDKIEDIIRQREDRKVINKITDMVRHIHNDVETVKRELFFVRIQINGIVDVLNDISLGIEVSDKQINDIIDLSTSVKNEADRGYSAVDEKDRIEWEKIIREREIT